MCPMNRTVLVVTALALVMGACVDSDTVTITEEDAGSTVEMTTDQVLELRIESNPTTGYEWVVLDPGVLEETSRSHRPESDDEGAGGVTTIRFTPTSTGAADLVLGYMRPFEEGEDPIERFIVGVVVVP